MTAGAAVQPAASGARAPVSINRGSSMISSCQKATLACAKHSSGIQATSVCPQLPTWQVRQMPAAGRRKQSHSRHQQQGWQCLPSMCRPVARHLVACSSSSSGGSGSGPSGAAAPGGPGGQQQQAKASQVRLPMRYCAVCSALQLAGLVRCVSSASQYAARPMRRSIVPQAISSALQPVSYLHVLPHASLPPLQWERFAGFAAAGDAKEAWLSIR